MRIYLLLLTIIILSNSCTPYPCMDNEGIGNETPFFKLDTSGNVLGVLFECQCYTNRQPNELCDHTWTDNNGTEYAVYACECP